MSKEGPINFGKPLLYLVLVGVAGGAVYLWKTWPSRVEGPGWQVDFPNRWETIPFEDATAPGKIVTKGPLLEEGMEGIGWVTVNHHGTLDWPQFVIERIPGTPDRTEDSEIAHKRSLFFEYQDNDARYLGAGVQRGDAVIIVAIGCAKHLFETNRQRFEKCIKSTRVMR